MLKRKPASNNIPQDWFGVSTSLFHGLCSDYISLRLLYCLEPYTTALTTLPKMVEVSEKSFKLFLTVHKKLINALADLSSVYGHNIEKLRAECAIFNQGFDEPDIKKFSKDLNDKKGLLFQMLRYGVQASTEGFEAELGEIMPVVDKIFFKSIMLLPESERRLLNFSSILKNLITKSRFDQSRNHFLLQKVLWDKNDFIAEYAEYCRTLDIEHENLMKTLNKAKGEPDPI